MSALGRVGWDSASIDAGDLIAFVGVGLGVQVRGLGCFWVGGLEGGVWLVELAVAVVDCGR